VAETAVKRLPWCGFRRTGKAMGQAYQCWWRICREINVLSSFEYHMFYVLYPFASYLLTLPRRLDKDLKGNDHSLIYVPLRHFPISNEVNHGNHD
jgi:hypothetical protein